ncbi:MAG: thrombospondin type 3 repeat-containing protein, partial [Oceanihabitans sediminis]
MNSIITSFSSAFIKKKCFTLLFLFLSFSLFSQTPISGIVNSYAAVTDITVSNCEPCEADCGDFITVTSTSGFSAGDKALIIQMKGATLNTSNSSEGGTITSINQAGNYEFFKIASVTATTIRIQYPLIRSYDVNGLVQIVKIPQYNAVDIVGELTAPAWNSATSTGGIVALSAEQIIFNANINVKGKGFKGLEMTVNGTPDNCSVNPSTQYVLPNTNNSSFDRGEGIAVPVAATNRGRAPRANGGGAGVSGDSGGGGGSNFGAGGIGGKRWCNADENGNTGIVAGGIGGFSMEPYLIQNKAFLGGGGGPGFITSSNFSLVPNGGGIVILFADTIEGNGYTIDADGVSPTAILPLGPADGGAGGGGGGTVLIKSDNINSNLTVNIRGGDGQDILDSDLHGPGGGGGGGVLLYSTPTLSPFVSLNNSGGAAGVHYNGENAIGGSENGAEPGGPGGARSLYNVIENTSYSADFDGDGVAAGCDLDSDNDGILDDEEGCGPAGIGNIDIISNFGVGNVNSGNGNNTDNGTYPTTIAGLNATYTFVENGSDIEVVNLSGVGQQGPVFKFTGKNDETAAIDIVFSEYVLGSSFKLTDFDENEEVIVDVYDQNGTLISLASSPYVASRGSQVSQENNKFSTYSNPGDTNGDNVSSDAVGSVSFNFRGLLISRINVSIKHVRNSSIRFTQVNQ